MDVRLSTEQRALRDSVAQVVDRLGPRTVAHLDDDERIGKLGAAVAATGWRDLRTPTDGGVPLAAGVEVGIVAEELGRGLADVAFLGPTLAAELRRIAGAPAAGAPETVLLTSDLGALAFAAGGIPRDARAVDAAGAAALVLVPAAGGHALASVDLPDATIGPDATTGPDLTRPTVAPAPGTAVRPVLDQAHVVGDGDLDRWTALGIAVTCADLVGVMRGAVDLAGEYAKGRRQYGRPVGAFQAVQHLLADALVATEGARSLALHAAWAVDALPPPEALAAAATAKAYAARAGRSVCETAIQVHGGIGNTWECLAHVYLRRALLSGDVLGGVGASLARVLDHHAIGGTRGLR